MHKQFNNKDMRKNKETKKLKEGEEVIFSDGKTLMEKVIVESIDKKGGFAVLSKGIKNPGTRWILYKVRW